MRANDRLLGPLMTVPLLAMLAGCQNGAEFNLFDKRVSPSGANAITAMGPHGAGENGILNLAHLINPDTKPDETDIQAALRAFYKDPADQQRRRNAVQEYILGVSNERCNLFIAYLQQSNSTGNFVLGSLATTAGAAGAIFTSADTARALSGIAGLFSGIRAEYNQDYFANLGVNVIADGIQERRRQVYQQIAQQGQTKAIADYTLEAAIKDAIYYHGECSLVAGLQQASSSIRTSANPGLDALLPALTKVNLARKILDTKAIDLSDIPGAQAANMSGTAAVAGTPNGVMVGPDLPLDALSAAIAATPVEAHLIKTKISALATVASADKTILRNAVDAAAGLATPPAAVNVLGRLAACQAKAGPLSQEVATKKAAVLGADEGGKAAAVANLNSALAAAKAAAAKVTALYATFAADAEAALAKLANATPPKGQAAVAAADVTTAKTGFEGAGSKADGC